ncbi:MAG: OmpH family outer membrane protein [Flavobacteriales bacterium]|nr:OmpH family outer membrane protein [Flavobacteriales bacterium]
MSKNTTILLVVWNIALTGLAAWGLLGRSSAKDAVPADEGTAAEVSAPVIVRDTGALKESRLAYFRLDSLMSECALFNDKNAQMQNTVRNLQRKLEAEEAAAQKRYEEIMANDAYSTQAEREKNQAEMEERFKKLQELQAEGEDKIAEMQANVAREVSQEVDEYLRSYNAQAGFDFIFSIRGDGQIWVGNDGLNITRELVTGLNARYRASKGTKK